MEDRIMSRTGDWGCTVSGRKYWPADPRPEDFCVEDIAHALANQCRFGGHCRTFYSVAQHSVHVSRVCDPADALWGLLHDASEAYIVDIPRPFKTAPGMEGYRLYENQMMRAVCEAFGLPAEIPASVKHADEVLLASEARDLMPEASVRRWYLPERPLDFTLSPWSPTKSRALFLARFHELTRTEAAA
jgi:hypothetical protein